MEIKREQVNILIEQGKKRGLTGKDVIDGLVRKGYQPEGVDVTAIKSTFKPQETVIEEKPSAFERIKTGIQEKGQKVQEQISGEGEFSEQTPFERGVGATATAFSAISNSVYNALPEGARNAIDTVAGGIGKGVNYLADKISNNPALQEFAMSDAGKDTERVSRVLSDLGIISGEILGTQQATKAITKGTDLAKQGIQTGKQAIETGVEETFTAGKKALPKSEEIMNRVARLTPTQARKFEQIAGKSHGQYLKETGNFGTPEQIIAKEAEKFAQSIKSVDDSLATLEGNFKAGVIDDILRELKQKATAESTKNVKSPYLGRVNELIQKNKKTGLNMSEINEAKRLYERNVKLGYNKVIDSEKIKRATNIDNALRKWQIEKAKELGFENLEELNKQTQLSKQLINSLGNEIVGKSGLNNINLTDWIVLSGGDPASVAGFLTKRFFSSKKIQSKIAEILNDQEIKPLVEPKITPATQATQQVE